MMTLSFVQYLSPRALSIDTKFNADDTQINVKSEDAGSLLDAPCRLAFIRIAEKEDQLSSFNLAVRLHHSIGLHEAGI